MCNLVALVAQLRTCACSLLQFITPWVFFTFAKTLVLQIITTVTRFATLCSGSVMCAKLTSTKHALHRHFVFWVMIISAFQRDIDPAERANDVKSFDFTQIPLLFGGIVYACICQVRTQVCVVLCYALLCLGVCLMLCFW